MHIIASLLKTHVASAPRAEPKWSPATQMERSRRSITMAAVSRGLGLSRWAIHHLLAISDGKTIGKW